MQAFVHGESIESNIVMVAVLDPVKVKEWAAENFKDVNIETENLEDDQYMGSLELKKLVIEDMKRLADMNKLTGLERIKDPKWLTMTLKPFTMENDLITPTQKLKRNKAKEIYATEIAKMYGKH